MKKLIRHLLSWQKYRINDDPSNLGQVETFIDMSIEEIINWVIYTTSETKNVIDLLTLTSIQSTHTLVKYTWSLVGYTRFRVNRKSGAEFASKNLHIIVKRNFRLGNISLCDNLCLSGGKEWVVFYVLQSITSTTVS